MLKIQEIEELCNRLPQEPHWIAPLIKVPCCFRLGKVAIFGKKEEKFLMVKVLDKDSGAVRLLW